MRRVGMGLAVAMALGCDPPTVISPSIMQRQDAKAITALDAAIPQRIERLLEGETGQGPFELDLVEFETADEAVSHRLFPDYRSAIAYAEKQGVTNFLPSADQINAITKQINDGLYARLELALENGEGGFQAKRQWLKAWLHQVHHVDVAARLAGALQIANERQAVSNEVQQRAQVGIDAFLSDPMLSRPIGFFTWSEALRTVFVRDRFLQGWFPQADGSQRAWLVSDGQVADGAENNLSAALEAARGLTGSARDGYSRTLAFYQKMTNHFSGYSPLDLEGLVPQGRSLAEALASIQSAPEPFLKYWALLPPSTSPESELFYRLDQLGLLKPGEDRMEALIKAIKSGELSLAPTAGSGFYAYQQHALEALLRVAQLPEGGVVTFGESYQKRLEEAFKTGMAKARETHAKQLDLFPQRTSAPAMPAGFVAEPLPTFYERLAKSYGYLKHEVLPLFNEDFLTSTRILEDGGMTGTATLADAVEEAELLMQGLAALSRADLGLAAVPEKDKAAATLAGNWLQQIGKDTRLGVDTRVAVPVNQYLDDKGQAMVQYWGTAGVTLMKLRMAPKGSAGDKTYWIATDKFLFFDRPYAAGPLDRDAYRRILDGASNLEAAKAALESGQN